MFDLVQKLINNGSMHRDTDVFEATEMLIAMTKEKLFKENLADQLINYNDEIIAIEDVGEKETIDISVTGDNLFFCNGILTKNSYGLASTADILFAVIRSEELDQLNQLMIKQLKNRYADINYYRKFTIGVDRSRMKLYDVEQSAQEDIYDSGQDDVPMFDRGKFGSRQLEEEQLRGFKFD